jgi:hypothetical protein
MAQDLLKALFLISGFGSSLFLSAGLVFKKGSTAFSSTFSSCEKIRFKSEPVFLADPGAEIQPGLNLLGPIKQKFLMVRAEPFFMACSSFNNKLGLKVKHT